MRHHWNSYNNLLIFIAGAWPHVDRLIAAMGKDYLCGKRITMILMAHGVFHASSMHDLAFIVTTAKRFAHGHALYTAEAAFACRAQRRCSIWHRAT